MSHKVRLTGRTRHRAMVRSLRPPLLVLQVEEHHSGYSVDGHGLGSDFEYYCWRDATTEDISTTGEVK